MRRDCQHIKCNLPDCSCPIDYEGLDHVGEVVIPELGNMDEQRIKEIQDMAAKGEKRTIVQVAIPKDSALRSILESVLNTLAGRNRAGKVIGKVKDVLSFFVPYGGKIDRLTDLVGNILFKPKQKTHKVMQDSKPWYKSVTVNSIIVIIALVANQFLDIDIAEEDLQNTIEVVGVAVASVVALWGRIRAQAQIQSK